MEESINKYNTESNSFTVIVDSICSIDNYDNDNPVKQYYNKSQVFQIKALNSNTNIPDSFNADYLDNILNLDSSAISSIFVLQNVRVSTEHDIDNLISFLNTLKSKLISVDNK